MPADSCVFGYTHHPGLQNSDCTLWCTRPCPCTGGPLHDGEQLKFPLPSSLSLWEWQHTGMCGRVSPRDAHRVVTSGWHKLVPSAVTEGSHGSPCSLWMSLLATLPARWPWDSSHPGTAATLPQASLQDLGSCTPHQGEENSAPKSCLVRGLGFFLSKVVLLKVSMCSTCVFWASDQLTPELSPFPQRRNVVESTHQQCPFLCRHSSNHTFSIRFCVQRGTGALLHLSLVKWQSALGKLRQGAGKEWACSSPAAVGLGMRFQSAEVPVHVRQKSD